MIREYLMGQIAKPDTYTAGTVELVSKGTIDVADTKYWKGIPKEGRIDVVLLRHEFNYENILGMEMDNAYYFYMSPKMDVIYYAHPDGGRPLFSLSEWDTLDSFRPNLLSRRFGLFRAMRINR